MNEPRQRSHCAALTLRVMLSWVAWQSVENFQSASLEGEDAGCWEHGDLFSLTLKYASAGFRYMCYEVTLELVKAEKLN